MTRGGTQNHSFSLFLATSACCLPFISIKNLALLRHQNLPFFLMGWPEKNSDEPLTPAGRLFLRPEMNTTILCAIGLKDPMDLDALKLNVKNSLMVQHPRFRSLLVRDKSGHEHWRRTEIDVDRHVILVDVEEYTMNKNYPVHKDDTERVINDYIADLSVSSPLSTDKPLWEIHFLVEQKCLIFRIHHALGDGISLMSMLLESCRKAEDPEVAPTMGTVSRRDHARGGNGRRRSWKGVLLGFLSKVLFSLVFCLEFVLRCLWVRDRTTVIAGGAGVELWPRKLATAKFWIEDMKVVKKAMANATINDVLLGVVSSGLSKYLDHRSPNALQEDTQITGVSMVNLREQPAGLQELSELMKNKSGSSWGNKFGFILLPIYYHKGGVDPLQYVKRAKKMIDRKKKTIEAHFSYKTGDLLMSWLGSKAACLLNYRILCNTTFTISNVVGPKEKITIAGNPVTFMRVNTSAIPHALTMHMVSYEGKAEMQILVAKDIIPDPEFLAKCFQDALLEMKEAALVSM